MCGDLAGWLVVTGEWAYYAVELVNGNIVGDLPVVDFRGDVSLTSGTMSATLALLHLDVDARREIVRITDPGRFSILATRNGQAVGEWIIWKRTRGNDLGGIQLDGAELISHLEHRLVQNWKWTQVDQINIALGMIRWGFKGEAALGGTIPIVTDGPLSGVLRDREYLRVDGTIGTRLRELSEVEDGFDYFITVDLPETGRSRVTRTVHLRYPRAGVDQPFVLDSAGTFPSGDILDGSVIEDATTLIARAYAIGSTVNDQPLISQYDDWNTSPTGRGYPFFERTQSWSSVEEQPTLDAYARELYRASQSLDAPSNLTILADQYPVVGDYGLGDRVRMHIEPTINFPDGYDARVRILGWTFSPPAGGPETVQLSIAQELDE